MKQTTFRVFSILFIALLVAGFVGQALLMCIAPLSGVSLLTFFVQDVASILAIYYLLSGCNKSAGSKYFKAFMITFAVLVLVSQMLKISIFGVMLMTLQFGALCLLSFGKDVGRSFSMILSWIITGLSALQLIVVSAFDVITNAALLRTGLFLVLSIGCVLMVIAKYADKKSRGTN